MATDKESGSRCGKDSVAGTAQVWPRCGVGNLSHQMNEKLGKPRKLGLRQVNAEGILTVNLCFCQSPNQRKVGSNNMFLRHHRERS